MWMCPKCNEENEDSYDVCFNCGTTGEGVENPLFHKADDVGPEYQGDRPMVEVLPQTSLPQALQPREPAPVEHPHWRPDACPHCGSQNLGRDTASPWMLIVAVLVLVVSGLEGRSGEAFLGVVGGLLGFFLLVFGLVAPFFTANAWCRDCGVRFKKIDRPETPAE